MHRTRNNKALRTLGLLLALLAALSMALPRVCFADGFEGLFYFSDDPYLAWQRLKPQMKDAAARAGVIDECLRILRFVDTYNNAADSPNWMHSEDGRSNARECAVAILLEIGPVAAPKVWELLAVEIRFQTPDVLKALQRARAAQSKASTALGDLRVEMLKIPALARKLNAMDAEPARDAEITYEWFILSTSVNHGAAQAVENPAAGPAQQPAKPHRLVALDPALLGMSDDPRREWVLAQQDPEALRSPAVAEALRRFTLLQTESYSRVSEYNAILQRGNFTMASVDMLPCDDYPSDLQRVLTGMGKDAAPVIQKDLHNPNREVAATAARLIATIKDLREFKAPSVQPAHPEARRIAEVALEAWDLSDETPQSKIAARALEDLRARGLAVYPDLIAILRSPRLKLKKEVLRALEMLSGERLGEDPAAWQKWHETAVEAEKHKPLPPDLATEGLTIGESPNAPKRPPKPAKPPAASENLPTPDKSDEEKTAGELLKDKFTSGGEEDKTGGAKSGETRPGEGTKAKTSNVDDEDADKKRYEKK